MKERVPDGKGRLKSELRSGQKFLIQNSSVDLTKYFFHLRFTVSTWYHLAQSSSLPQQYLARQEWGLGLMAAETGVCTID
jgi:hypothetical protein